MPTSRSTFFTPVLTLRWVPAVRRSSCRCRRPPRPGDYTIVVPGQVGQKVCADATGPVGGGQAEAPVVHLKVNPTCPP